jgi:predicted component of type VI protein secretion system
MKSLWLVPPEGEPIRIQEGPVTIGRDAGAGVVLSHQSVSRRHAVIEHEDGAWLVADQKSGNGTWIDGQRIIKALLREGQNLRFGAVGFTVSLHDPGRSRRSPTPPPLPAKASVSVPTPVPAMPVPSAGANPTPVPSALPRGSLSVPEAAEILGVTPGAAPDEIRSQYQRIYNDLQIRLTNAPTASLKRMYQKNLQNLKLAAETLSPGVLGGR